MFIVSSQTEWFTMNILELNITFSGKLHNSKVQIAVSLKLIKKLINYSLSTKSKTLKAEQTSLIQHFYPINFAELTRGRKKMKMFQDQRGYKQLLPSVFLFFFLTHSPLNRPCGSRSFLPIVTSSVLTVNDNFLR